MRIGCSAFLVVFVGAVSVYVACPSACTVCVGGGSVYGCCLPCPSLSVCLGAVVLFLDADFVLECLHTYCNCSLIIVLLACNNPPIHAGVCHGTNSRTNLIVIRLVILLSSSQVYFS